MILRRVSFYNTKIRISRRKRSQKRNYFNPLVRGPGRFEWWKNWELKISLDCPFKGIILRDVYTFFFHQIFLGPLHNRLVSFAKHFFVKIIAKIRDSWVLDYTDKMSAWPWTTVVCSHDVRVGVCRYGVRVVFYFWQLCDRMPSRKSNNWATKFYRNNSRSIKLQTV